MVDQERVLFLFHDGQ